MIQDQKQTDSNLLVLKGQPIPQEYQTGVESMNNIANNFKNCMIMLGVWQKNQVPQVCQYIKQWRLPVSLFVQYNMHATILKDISHIYFPTLRKLFLRSNHIESIEIISHLNMPLLELIWLGNNRICTLRSLKRANFPHLNSLTVCCNYLVELENLNELYAPHLTSIDLQRSDTDDHNRFTSLQILAKIQSSQPQMNLCKNEDIKGALNMRRLKEGSLSQSLRKKYPSNQFHI